MQFFHINKTAFVTVFLAPQYLMIMTGSFLMLQNMFKSAARFLTQHSEVLTSSSPPSHSPFSSNSVYDSRNHTQVSFHSSSRIEALMPDTTIDRRQFHLNQAKSLNSELPARSRSTLLGTNSLALASFTHASSNPTAVARTNLSDLCNEVIKLVRDNPGMLEEDKRKLIATISQAATRVRNAILTPSDEKHYSAMAAVQSSVMSEAPAETKWKELVEDLGLVTESWLERVFC